MDKLTYYLFRFLVVLMRLIPFWFLYAIANFIYFILYKIVGYRVKVVNDNLTKAFPNKTAKEIKALEQKFFRHLSTIMLESIKGYSMTAEEIIARFKITNPEVADKYFDQGKNVMALASHYANWEWAVEGVSAFKHHVLGIYRPLTNKYIDAYLKKKRSTAIELVPVQNTRSSFAKEREKPGMFVLVADQNPGNAKHAIWLDFLGIDTAWVHGPEFFTRYYKMPVVYLDFKRVKRGYYELNVIDLGEDLWKTPQGEITEIYMKTLENIIQEKPEHWLWSHKRWKRTREKPAEKET